MKDGQFTVDLASLDETDWLRAVHARVVAFLATGAVLGALAAGWSILRLVFR